jgi:hypothetical protein
MSSVSLEGAVQLLLDLDRDFGQRGPKQLERFLCADGGRAEHERGRDSQPAKVLCDPLRVPQTSGRERALTVGQRRIVPAGLRMAKEIERLHRAEQRYSGSCRPQSDRRSRNRRHDPAGANIGKYDLAANGPDPDGGRVYAPDTCQTAGGRSPTSLTEDVLSNVSTCGYGYRTRTAESAT